MMTEASAIQVLDPPQIHEVTRSPRTFYEQKVGITLTGSRLLSGSLVYSGSWSKYLQGRVIKTHVPTTCIGSLVIWWRCFTGSLIPCSLPVNGRVMEVYVSPTQVRRFLHTPRGSERLQQVWQALARISIDQRLRFLANCYLNPLTPTR